jgi:hypothetical protein
LPEVPAPPAEQTTVQHFLRPRLTAIAPDAAEAVRYAGGGLFDRAMDGWDVTVITASACDPPPLRILGVRARAAETLLAGWTQGPCLRAVAVRAELYEADPRVRQLVLAAAAADGEVRLWGEARPPDFDDAADVVSHRLSMAARAFKAHALRAAGVTGPAGTAEMFRLGSVRESALAAAI